MSTKLPTDVGHVMKMKTNKTDNYSLFIIIISIFSPAPPPKLLLVYLKVIVNKK